MDFLYLAVAPPVLTVVFPPHELVDGHALVISWMKCHHHLFPFLEMQLR
jgi:hypothetical protein